MAVATGSESASTQFDVPSNAETGPSQLFVAANGIPLNSVNVTVQRWFSTWIEVSIHVLGPMFWGRLLKAAALIFFASILILLCTTLAAFMNSALDRSFFRRFK
jgi:hypothetical protein